MPITFFLKIMHWLKNVINGKKNGIKFFPNVLSKRMDRVMQINTVILINYCSEIGVHCKTYRMKGGGLV
jgi:hypothetical protein